MGVDVVHEGEGVLVVAVLVLQGDIDIDIVAGGREMHRLGVERLLVAVEILHELDQTALVEELLHLGSLLALVGQHDPDAAVEEGELAEPLRQGVPRVFQHRENLRVGLEGHRGAGAGRHPDHAQLLGGVAADKRHLVARAGAIDRDRQLFGEGVDHRDADAVQPARDLVGVLVELAAGVQHGEREFDSRQPLGGVDVDRNAAAVVVTVTELSR